MQEDLIIQIRRQLDALPPEERAECVEAYKTFFDIALPTEVPFGSLKPKTSYRGTWQAEKLDKK